MRGIRRRQRVRERGRVDRDDRACRSETTSFGDLDSPCGKGDASVAEGEGPSTDKLLIGVPNDRSADIRPGLNKEFWDTAQAYQKWCNDQGGIQGLPIELVDLDGQVTNVEAAMTKACTEVFAMVGGGFAQDQLEFSGNAGSDFHECGLIDIPAFAVSIEKSLSNGKVEPLPNPADQVSTQWVRDFKELYPDETEKLAIVYGELPSMATVAAQFNAAAEKEGVNVVDEISYPIIGADDWGPYADLVIDSGATSVYWIGEPVQRGEPEPEAAREGLGGRDPAPDQRLRRRAVLLRQRGRRGFGAAHRLPPLRGGRPVAGHPAVPGHARRDPRREAAALGLQAMSAWLLFSVAADSCATKNDGVIDRNCVLEESAAVEDWTAGGLHVPTDPGGDPPECGMLLVAKDGAVRAPLARDRQRCRRRRRLQLPRGLHRRGRHLGPRRGRRRPGPARALTVARRPGRRFR